MNSASRRPTELIQRAADDKHRSLASAQVGTEVSADYAAKDFQGYGVMFPSRIVQKIDGRTVADLTVTEALANPYLIFPPPKEMVQR
jgi:hypothetical protein